MVLMLSGHGKAHLRRRHRDPRLYDYSGGRLIRERRTTREV
jgi:hypothetical protein